MPVYVEFDAFGRLPTLVAQVFRAADVFSMLKRRVHVPVQCTAMVWGESGGARLVRDASYVESEGAVEIMLVRNSPIELTYVIPGLLSRDGFPFSANIELSVCPVPERADLVLLRGALLGSRDRADVGRVRLFCEESVRAAAALFARERDAAEIASAAAWDTFDGLLAEHFKPIAFQSGLALGRDVRATFSSTAFAESQRSQQAARLRQERLEADTRLRNAALEARKAHLSNLEPLLEKARALAAQSPGTGVADLIRSFDPAQRGELYQGLMITARPNSASGMTEAILAVAGDELLWFEPARLDRPTRMLSLASPAGGLRSVRVQVEDGRRTILVGAGRGVHVLDPDGDSRQTYLYDTTAAPRGGFNAAVRLGDRVFASHSEIGVVEWSATVPGGVRRWETQVPATARSVRDIQTDETGRLWFTVDDRILGLDPSDAAAPVEWRAPGVVTALAVADGRVVAGLRDGRVVSWLTGAPEALDTLRGPSGRAVESLARIAGGGVERVVVSDGHAHLDVRVLGDAHCMEYRAPQPVKWAFAADDWLVGVNEGRDQLLVWRPDSPDEPSGSVSVGRVSGRSIQDVALLPARTPASAT